MASIIKVICGPTASGKSARALDIAQSQNGVIINADAMQVYEELRIVTARPTPADEAQVAHKLYGCLNAAEICSAARWLGLARTAIDETFAAGKMPVVTGGTGLYLKALMEGLSPIPDIDAAFRQQATQLWQERGADALKEYDAAMHAQLKAGDQQRHVRALEVILATGKSLTYWQGLPREKPYADVEFDIEIIDIARGELYARCDARFLSMLDAGALEEVRALHALKLSDTMPAMRAVGVPELIGYLEQKWSLEEAIIQAQQATRNYAKRQLTWFRNQLG